MISFYTGTPGSGKSYHMTQRIYNALRNHEINIICNYPINLENCALTWLGWIKRKITDKYDFEFKTYNQRPLKGHFYYWDNSQVTVKNLLLFDQQNHRRMKGRDVDKPQTIVMLDEAGIVFNCRGYMDSSRNDWTTFFAKHRHYHYEFVLACQFDRQVDRQIRYCVEYEWKHRKLSNFKLFGQLLKFLFRGELFLTFQSWYATKDNAGLGRDLIRFSSRVASVYDTMGEFSASLGSDAAGSLPAGCTADDGGQGDPSPQDNESHEPDAPEPADRIACLCNTIKACCSSASKWLRAKFVLHKDLDVLPELSDTMDLSKLFGGDVDVTKPISEQEAEHDSQDA